LLRDAEGVRAAVADEGTSAKDPLLSGSLFPEFSAKTLRMAKFRYMFEVGGTDRIAGYKGRKISILPKDRFRYGYELWLEEESGLLLRWVLYDADRLPLAKLMFTDLSMAADLDRAELKSTTPMAQMMLLEDAPVSTLGEALARDELPQGMPVGFRMVAHSTSSDADSLEHMVFSDGLASVSVYVEPLGEEGEMASGLSRMGTTNAWAKSAAQRHITVMGEVPPITVKRIGYAFMRDLEE
jgi:sigma-E factor negative regulatory protein RseB